MAVIVASHRGDDGVTGVFFSPHAGRGEIRSRGAGSQVKGERQIGIWPLARDRAK